MHFPELNRDSKVWVYASNRELTTSEVEQINKEIIIFINNWAAHGDSLYGSGKVLHNRFVVLAVDESQVNASGCSIDTSVQFIKALGQEFNVDFMDRINLTVEKDGVYNRVHISDIKEHKDSHVFNPMITKLAELDSSWKVKVADSPFV